MHRQAYYYPSCAILAAGSCMLTRICDDLRMLTYIQARIRDPNAATRTTVLSAIRYTFADSSPAFDDILAPYIIDFLSLMEDAELVIISTFLIYSN